MFHVSFARTLESQARVDELEIERGPDIYLNQLLHARAQRAGPTVSFRA